MSRPNQIKANKLKTIHVNACPLKNQKKTVGNLRQPLPVIAASMPSQQTKLTTYRNLSKEQKPLREHTVRVDKVFQVFSKAQIMYKLRFQTIFLAFSILEKTVHISVNMESNEYFFVSCLFIAMKYQEIYPPRLKQLGVLFQFHIKKQIYQKCELMVLKELDYNMSFEGINQSLSQYLQNLSSSQMYFVFFLLEIALANRVNLRIFSLKEIVLSVVYILCSHSIYIGPRDQVDGIKFDNIQRCSKMILLFQIQSQSSFPAVNRKFRSDSMKYTSMRSLPVCESLTKLIRDKTIQHLSIRKTIVKLQNLTMEEEEAKQQARHINQAKIKNN